MTGKTKTKSFPKDFLGDSFFQFQTFPKSPLLIKWNKCLEAIIFQRISSLIPLLFQCCASNKLVRTSKLCTAWKTSALICVMLLVVGLWNRFNNVAIEKEPGHVFLGPLLESSLSTGWFPWLSMVMDPMLTRLACPCPEIAVAVHRGSGFHFRGGGWAQVIKNSGIRWQTCKARTHEAIRDLSSVCLSTST